MPIVVELLLRIVVSLVSLSSALTGALAPDAVVRPTILQACSVGRSGQDGCDPVNLMFPGASWEQVRDALRDAGWTTAGFGSRQVFDFGIEGVVPEAEQLFFADGDDTRYHIRLWQGRSLVTYASVHHEVDDLAGLTHRIDAGWEVAEAFVADGLCATARACSQTTVDAGQNELQGGDGEWRGWANDARLTVIVLP